MDFIERVMSLVRKEYPEKTFDKDDKQLGTDIGALTDMAGMYRLSQEQDVFEFIMLSYRMGPGFELEPAHRKIHGVLTHRGMSGKIRIDRIYKLLFFSDDLTSS